MTCIWSFHGRSRLAGGWSPSTAGPRALPTLLSIVIIVATNQAVTEAFDGNEAKFDTGSVAAGGTGSLSSTVDDLAPWDNGINRLDICAHRRDVAQACFNCPNLMPSLGVTAWQCCHDPGARRACAEAAAIALYGHSAALSVMAEEGDAADVDGEPEDNVADDVIEKRAKYFLGKRAKYFLGKRVFGERRLTGAHRPAMKHEMMADDYALFEGPRRLRAAVKRAKYFLG